ncbi:MAG: hypothetical protein LBV36_08400 [Chromatiales bacterium]|nr:hypothetical protein [Chromatiales bacterium]
MEKRKAFTGVLVASVLAVCCGQSAQALEVGVFGDMSLSSSNAPHSEPNFRLGSLDLYAHQYIDGNTGFCLKPNFKLFPVAILRLRFSASGSCAR